MARLNKTGLEYFSVFVSIFEDIKLRKINKICGFGSGEIIIRSLCCIYENGYFIELDDDLCFLISERAFCDDEFVKKVINTALQMNFFNKDLFEKYNILTSRRIQETYLYVVKTSKLKRAEIDELYKLGSYSEEIDENSEENDESSEEIPKNSEESTQSKGKKSKEKKSKENESKVKQITPDETSDFFKLFAEWWQIFDYAPYPDSYECCLSEWYNLTYEEAVECLNISPEYVKTRPDKKYRHNPLNYLKLRIWQSFKNVFYGRRNNQTNSGNNAGNNPVSEQQPEEWWHNIRDEDDPTYGKIL